MTSKIELEDDVSEIQQLVGPPTALFIGFGMGHVVEGRWKERGWIFTFGETAATTAWMGSYLVDNSCSRHCNLVAPMAITGLISLLGLHVWETIDSVTGARAKNRRVMMQRVRLAPLLQPPRVGSGGVAGLSLTF